VKRNLTQAIVKVAEQLGNTPAICRKCYVHPTVIDGYLDGTLLGALAELGASTVAVDGLRVDEAMVLAFLRGAHADATEPLAEKLARSLTR
jgi:DNA topoisomerase-1